MASETNSTLLSADSGLASVSKSATSATSWNCTNSKVQAAFREDNDASKSVPLSADEESSMLKAVSSYDGPLRDKMQDIISKCHKSPLQEFKALHIEEFVCGWGAAFINITLTFPINKAIFRQQLQGISGFRAVKQLKNEGLSNLYRGLLPPLLQKTTTLSIMFGTYHKFQEKLDSTFQAVPKQLNHAAAAMMAGTVEMTLAPFERIQTLLQDRTYHRRFHNSFHAAKELWAFGPQEYYRGLTIIFLRNGPSNICFFLGRECLNELMPDIANDSSRFAKDFICGACLGALISTGFFPLNVVKTHMQSRLGGPFYGVWHTFQEVWIDRKRRLPNLFRGVHLNYTRSFISWGIVNASYEYLMQLFQRLRIHRDL